MDNGLYLIARLYSFYKYILLLVSLCWHTNTTVLSRLQHVVACENIQKLKRYTRWLTTAPTVCTGQQLFWPLVPIWLFRSKTETAYRDGVNSELGGNTNRDILFEKQKRAQAVCEVLENLFVFGHFMLSEFLRLLQSYCWLKQDDKSSVWLNEIARKVWTRGMGSKDGKKKSLLLTDYKWIINESHP